MDDDDISFSQRFEKQIAFLKKHPEITAVGCAFSSNPSGRGNNIFFPEDPEELKTLTFIEGADCSSVRHDSELFFRTTQYPLC